MVSAVGKTSCVTIVDSSICREFRLSGDSMGNQSMTEMMSQTDDIPENNFIFFLNNFT